MKQTLNFANVVSSTCSMFCFVDQVWVWIYLAASVLGNPTPHPQGRYKSCPSDRKTHIRNYKSICSQEIRYIYLIYFKKRIIWSSNFEVLALDPRSQKSCPEWANRIAPNRNDLSAWNKGLIFSMIVLQLQRMFFFVIGFVSYCFLCWFLYS